MRILKRAHEVTYEDWLSRAGLAASHRNGAPLLRSQL